MLFYSKSEKKKWWIHRCYSVSLLFMITKQKLCCSVYLSRCLFVVLFLSFTKSSRLAYEHFCLKLHLSSREPSSCCSFAFASGIEIYCVSCHHCLKWYDKLVKMFYWALQCHKKCSCFAFNLWWNCDGKKYDDFIHSIAVFDFFFPW